jgi:hypothetical protein
VTMPSSGKIGEAGGVDTNDVEDSGLSSWAVWALLLVAGELVLSVVFPNDMGVMSVKKV